MPARKSGKGKGKKGRNNKQKKAESKSAKAGLTFPVGRISRFLKDGNYTQRIGAGAPVYMTAVLEYICAELLELSGNAAKDHKRSRIRPRDIQLAVRSDEELNIVMGNAIIAAGGGNAKYSAKLLPANKKKKVRTKQENQHHHNQNYLILRHFKSWNQQKTQSNRKWSFIPSRLYHVLWFMSQYHIRCFISTTND